MCLICPCDPLTDSNLVCMPRPGSQPKLDLSELCVLRSVLNYWCCVGCKDSVMYDFGFWLKQFENHFFVVNLTLCLIKHLAKLTYGECRHGCTLSYLRIVLRFCGFYSLLRRVFVPKRDEVTGELRKLHNEELSDLCSLPNIVRVVKSRRMR